MRIFVRVVSICYTWRYLLPLAHTIHFIAYPRPIIRIPFDTALLWSTSVIKCRRRDLSPFNFQPMKMPFLELELNCFGVTHKVSTEKSKRWGGEMVVLIFFLLTDIFVYLVVEFSFWVYAVIQFTYSGSLVLRPNPSNPNYLQRLVMPVTLPAKSLFAQPLNLTAKDTRWQRNILSLVCI